MREELIKTSETEGLGEITAMEFYENGVRSASSQYVQAKDNKKMYYSGDIKRVVNYPDGYILDIPQDWAPDYSMSTVRVRYTTDQVTLIATNEDEIYDNYDSAQDYIESIFQYITAETYMKVNRVEKLSEETLELQDGYKAYVLKMHLLDCEETIKELLYLCGVLQWNQPLRTANVQGGGRSGFRVGIQYLPSDLRQGYPLWIRSPIRARIRPAGMKRPGRITIP